MRFHAVLLVGLHLLLPALSAAQTFEDVSASQGLPVDLPSFGNGVWTDFNGDGLLDIFVGNHHRPPSFYQGGHGGQFSKRRARDVGLRGTADRHGVAWADYDNDGDLDVLITVGGGRGEDVGTKSDQLFRNGGAGVFSNVTAAAKVANAWGRGRSASWVDVDRDGRLDLFVKNHKTPNVLLLNKLSGFADVSAASGLRGARGTIMAWGDYDGDGDQDLATTGGDDEPDQLWRNEGNNVFTDVTAAAHLGQLADGMGLAWGDYDDDGDLDLFVARGYDDQGNDYEWDGSRIRFSDDENMADGLDFATTGDSVRFNLYVAPCGRAETVFIGGNRRHPRTMPFTLTGAPGRPSYVEARTVGFFVWSDAAGWHVRWSNSGPSKRFLGEITSNGRFTRVTSVRAVEARGGEGLASSLYRNEGDGTFTDVAAAAGLGTLDNARGVVWGDSDNDGDLDLYVVSAGTLLGGNGSNHLYVNLGNGTFRDAIEAGAAVVTDGRGDGAAFGDYDGDGALDLLVTNGFGRNGIPGDETACANQGPTVVLHNKGPVGHWVTLRLRGVTSNRDAVGARVEARVGGRTQRRDIMGGGGGQIHSQGPGRLVHFGLGEAMVADSVVITWPSGRVQTLGPLAGDRIVDVVEP